MDSCHRAAYEPTTLRALYEEKEEIEGYIQSFQDDKTFDPDTRNALINECNADLARVKQEILNWEWED